MMRGLQAHMHEFSQSLRSSSRTFKFFTFLCTQYTVRSTFSKQDIIQLHLLFYLSCCYLDTKLLTTVNLRSSTPLSTSFVDVPSSASFPNHLLFGKSGHKSTSQRISFSPIPFFFLLPWPTIFFSQTAM